MEKTNDFFEWYKQKITENPQDPPAEAWENIADELDTNDVWDRVAADLDHRGGWFSQKPWSYAIPAALLLILAGGFFLYFDKNAAETPSTTVATYADADGRSTDKMADADPLADHATADKDTNQSMESSDSMANRSNDENRELPSGETETFENNEEIAVDGNAMRVDIAASIQENAILQGAEKDDHDVAIDLAGKDSDAFLITEIASDSTASEHGVTSAQNKQNGTSPSMARVAWADFSVDRIAMPDSMLTISPVVVTVQHDSAVAGETTRLSLSPQFRRTFEFGISGSIKNTWLLNQTTFMGLERQTLTATLPDFGKNIGVAIRYNLSPLFSAQAEGFFISDMGQRYNEYRKGKYIEREIDLNYFHGSLLFKYGNNAMIMDRLVNGHGIIGGFYFSKLKSASETIDHHTTDLGDAYAPIDYGIVIGYEYNQRLFSNFFFTSGLRLNYGLKNIRPSTASKTNTGSFDVNLGLRYRF